MKGMNSGTRRLLIAGACLVLTACALQSARPVPALSADAPAVAAAFRWEVMDESGRRESGEWRYWRSDDRIIRESRSDHTGEEWQRDGAALFYSWLDHDARRGISFQRADLDMLGSPVDWRRQGWIVDPALLALLTETRPRWRDGYPCRHYAGSVNGVRWDIVYRVDVMLPVTVIRQTGRSIEKLSLTKASTLADAPWQPPSSDSYDLLDFADLGDHERDPFVMQVQERFGIAHGH